MIAKTKDAVACANRFERAGAAAEEQMAFYLRRSFGDSPDIIVINDLRLVDAGDSAQIDHLVLHPFGIVIIESKSISGEIEVNGHGEFFRHWNGRQQGMPSPIQQAKRQAEFLRTLLNQHREALRDKRLLGHVQPGFTHCPIVVRVAISDKGIIVRERADPPELAKADSICEGIRQEIARHRKASSFFTRPDGDYGVWGLNSNELARVADFLLKQHTPHHTEPRVATPEAPRSSPPVAPASAPIASATGQTGYSCKHCGSDALVGSHSKYGYYFKCGACQKSTPIDYACTACGKKARIRKQGSLFHRVCEACGREELVWTNSTSN